MGESIEEKVAGFPEITNILEYMETVTQESERKQAPQRKMKC